jgi:cell division protein ZapD|tara:strand:- start:1324 stop:2094 length:771 start_codon:yes stop_codon:yes gene_type:complete
MNDKIVYEHPMNERIRSLLRLEHLYKIIYYHLDNDGDSDYITVLATLIQISDLLLRSDIKNEIIKELKRQNDIFEALKASNEIDTDKLDIVKNIINDQLSFIQNPLYQPGDVLKNNEFVKIFSQRMRIPAGTCNFDLPRLHHWLQRSEQEKKEDIYIWSSDLNPISQSTHTLLNNIRESSNPIYQNAESGFYHQQIDSITPCQLIRIKIDSASTFYPDISGIKNRFTVRFMEIESLNKKQVQTKNNINFELHCCNL